MPSACASPIAAYIARAPLKSRAHLQTVHSILQGVAPPAQQVIKWGAPFFVEPRFLFSFAAFQSHMVFAPSQQTLAECADALKGHATTRNYLKLPYAQPVPEVLVRRLAEHQLARVKARQDEAFW